MLKSLVAKIIVAGSVLTLGFLAFTKLMPQPADVLAEEEGGVIIKVIDQNGDVVLNKAFQFEEGESLWDVHWRNNDQLNIGCNDAFYSSDIDYTCSFYAPYLGYSLRAIAGVESSWYGSYLQLFKNDVRANLGISSLRFEDGDVIEWRWTKL